MSLRKPLVIVSGQVEQLQSGDVLDAAVEGGGNYILTNNESGAIVIGAPVYSQAVDAVKKAKADSLSTAVVVGLVSDTSIANGASGNIKLGGVLTATTAQWDAVAGTTGGLTFNTLYFLSASTAGQITATAPTTVGQVVTQIGVALSTTELLIAIRPAILL
jgi:hypothetical protein